MLSKIVGCKKSEIKNNLQPLVENYPDIGWGSHLFMCSSKNQQTVKDLWCYLVTIVFFQMIWVLLKLWYFCPSTVIMCIDSFPYSRKSHLSAVLFFRGLIRGRERHVILQRLMELKQNIRTEGNEEQILFTDIQAALNTDCFAGTPFTCLSSIVPDS